MKKIIIILFSLLIALNVFAITKEDLYDNNTNIKAVYVIINPYPSKLQVLWDFLNKNSEYMIDGIIDKEKDYYYTISIYELKNTKTVADFDAEMQKVLGGLVDSKVVLVGKDYHNADLLKALGVSK